jgi:hypothetical protein
LLIAGHVILEVLPPIDTTGVHTNEEITELSVRTRDIMLKCFERISPEAAVLTQKRRDQAKAKSD